MNIAIITYPKDINMPTNNIHNWWIPPNYIIEYWSGACKIEFISDTDYDQKKLLIHTSILSTITQINHIHKLINNLTQWSDSTIEVTNKKVIIKVIR